MVTPTNCGFKLGALLASYPSVPNPHLAKALALGVGSGDYDMPRMTLTNETVVFYKDAIVIQPVLSDSFRFEGTPDQLVAIMVAHPELDIDNCSFRVRGRNVQFYVSPSVDGY